MQVRVGDNRWALVLFKQRLWAKIELIRNRCAYDYGENHESLGD